MNDLMVYIASVKVNLQNISDNEPKRRITKDVEEDDKDNIIKYKITRSFCAADQTRAVCDRSRSRPHTPEVLEGAIYR